MRTLLLFVLAAAVIGLVYERFQMADELKTTKTSLEESQKKVADLERQLQLQLRGGVPGQPNARPDRNWLQERIENGRHALDAPGSQSPGSRPR